MKDMRHRKRNGGDRVSLICATHVTHQPTLSFSSLILDPEIYNSAVNVYRHDMATRSLPLPNQVFGGEGGNHAMMPSLTLRLPIPSIHRVHPKEIHINQQSTINQSINQSVSQSINQSISHSVNQQKHYLTLFSYISPSTPALSSVDLSLQLSAS